jgi:hypothetical protein
MKEKLLLVNIYGGLGNQLFQYSTGYALAKREGRALVLIDCCYDDRDFGLLDFPIKDRIEERAFKLRYTSLRKVTTWIRMLSGLKVETFEDPILKIDDRIFEKCSADVLVLNGYWGWKEYFQSIKSDLVDLLLMQQQSIIDTEFCTFGMDDSVALHVRRGDYANVNQNTFELLSIDYYLRAIELIDAKLDSPVYYIFTDDNQYFECEIEPILLKHTKHRIVLTSPNKRPSSVLVHMATCRHQIIANSTFSWWAAFLNTNNNKIVIQPCKWYTHLPSQELYETGKILTDNNWIKL